MRITAETSSARKRRWRTVRQSDAVFQPPQCIAGRVAAPYELLTSENTAFILIDHQVGSMVAPVWRLRHGSKAKADVVISLTLRLFK
jgi:hypothetical protein